MLLLFLLLASAASPIKHVVLLMFENRAFDHMLGHLPHLDGCARGAQCSNPLDPMARHSPRVQQTFDSQTYVDLNPDHQVPAALVGLYGSLREIEPPTMTGFIVASNKSEVMRGYNETSLPILSTLAQEFTVLDKYFSSVPGPTGPNRMYALSGTSHGAARNIDKDEAVGYWQRTFFDDVLQSNLDWRIFFGDFPTCLELGRLRGHPTRFRHTEATFFKDVANGELPAFTFIEPRWYDDFGAFSQTQHPPHSVYHGELLLKQVYEALRASDLWNSTVLLITYDEHGGLPDHVPPPFGTSVPNPDGRDADDPLPFKFDRLGIRVPMVVVSPWVAKGGVEGSPAVNAYEHTSIAKTVRSWLAMSVKRPLTKREDWAASFAHILQPSMRTDAPRKLPAPFQGNAPTKPALDQLLTDLQIQVTYTAWRVGGGQGQPPDFSKWTQLQGARFVRQQLAQFQRPQN